MAKLITEHSLNVAVNEAVEENGGKSLYIEGIFSSFGKRNNNGRVYEEKILKREVNEAVEKVKNRKLWGELGHPESPNVNPDQIAIKVESLEWKGQDLYGKAKILNTPKGLIAAELVKEGQIGISSRGLGTVSSDGNVNEDYKLITWDLVLDPSNKPSWVNGIYEGKEWEIKEVEKEETVEVKEEKVINQEDRAKLIKEAIKSIDKKYEERQIVSEGFFDALKSIKNAFMKEFKEGQAREFENLVKELEVSPADERKAKEILDTEGLLKAVKFLKDVKAKMKNEGIFDNIKTKYNNIITNYKKSFEKAWRESVKKYEFLNSSDIEKSVEILNKEGLKAATKYVDDIRMEKNIIKMAPKYGLSSKETEEVLKAFKSGGIGAVESIIKRYINS